MIINGCLSVLKCWYGLDWWMCVCVCVCDWWICFW